ncbi:decarboxylase, partial [Candidatus Woesearchaeota archaeon]|nr:decarboxylase [Candidatus Woesearchaeota archaeon]
MAKFILSKKIMHERFEKIAVLCDELSYSAKTNYEVATLLEQETTCSFNLHFLTEVEKIVDKKRIWFFPQGWNETEIQELLSTGVDKFVLDNERDLRTLIPILEKENVQVSILLRMKLKENTIHTGKYFVYGMRSDMINKFVSELKDNKHIETLGVHFHRKTQNISEWSLLYELEQLLTEETLEAIKILDIGGGLPVQYKNFRAEVLPNIFAEVKKLRTWLDKKKITFMIEPGRFIAAPAIKLQTTIRNIYDDTIVVDASTYNSAVDTFVVHYKLLVEGELPQNSGRVYTIKGYTPCSMDLFRYRVYLPELKVGDTLTFLNAGAYNFGTDFCSLP